MLAVLLAMSLASTAIAQQRSASASIERQIVACFDRHDYQAALDLIQERLQVAPNDAGMLYNAACAHALMGKPDEAASTLLLAVKAGFRDFDHMQVDSDLKSIRHHPTYLAIVEASDRVTALNGLSAVDRWKAEHPSPAYRYTKDEKRHLTYATALDADADQRMREMLERETDQLLATIFDKPPTYTVLIAIPTPEDADKFFHGQDEVGGMYDHTLKQLTARNIGGSLRHEFFHVMHFGDMERRNQQHPLWMQEGLASLYEDYELSADGSIKFLPNDRQIIVKRRAKSGILIKWKELFGLSSKQFMNRAQELYPQVRSIFEFVADQGKLTEWYRTYVRGFDDDETGVKTFEAVFNKPLSEVEKQWRQWIASQPEVDVTIGYGDASMGIRAGDGSSNDGVKVADVIPKSAAGKAGLKRGDVIVSIDGQLTPSGPELRQIVAAHKVGDIISVRVRRDGQYLTFSLTLQALTGGM
jgi:tetratricopeptide (TPR) repeat protein